MASLHLHLVKHLMSSSLSSVTPGRWARLPIGALALAVYALASAQVKNQADLSMLSDFGVSDLVSANQRGEQVAGIKQAAGNGNLALIEQSGDNNLAQVWQQGDNNSAKVVQDGSSNETRLWQEGNGHHANLTQMGSDNQIAAVQHGFGSVLDGRQQGDGNKAAVVLSDDSRLTFSQIGNNNTIEQTVPSKIVMEIIQTGTGTRVNVAGQ